MNVERNLLETWRAAAGLGPNEAPLALVQAAVRDLIDSLDGANEEIEEDALYRYRVPMLSEDGSCSIIEEMSPTPYDLAPVLGGRSDVTTRKLRLLNQLAERAANVTGAGWVGIYQRRERIGGLASDPSRGAEALIKLAYRGRPSRAEFPLTDAFAQGSTNSQVGLSGKAKLIPDVEAHMREGGGFYVCDTAVQSEACLPIFATGSMEVVGIIDAEAEPKAFFTPERLSALVAACMVAGPLLP
jgi:L-methionine (R)-S-oxide reductase